MKSETKSYTNEGIPFVSEDLLRNYVEEYTHELNIGGFSFFKKIFLKMKAENPIQLEHIIEISKELPSEELASMSFNGGLGLYGLMDIAGKFCNQRNSKNPMNPTNFQCTKNHVPILYLPTYEAFARDIQLRSKDIRGYTLEIANRVREGDSNILRFIDFASGFNTCKNAIVVPEICVRTASHCRGNLLTEYELFIRQARNNRIHSMLKLTK